MEVLGGEHTAVYQFRRAKLQPLQVVQRLIAQLLGELQVGGGMHDHGRVAPSVGPDAQGNLLGHDAGGHKHSGFFAKLGGDFRLEGGEVVATAVGVGVLAAI